MSLVGKLASRLGRSSAWYVFASAGVVAAIAAVTSLLTWWPNDGDKPIVHPAEAIERLLPEGALDRVDGQVASLLGVDKEAVRAVRKGLVQGGSGITPQLGGRLYEIATGQPVSDSSSPGFATLVPASLPTPGTDAPVPIPEEPSQATGEAPAPVPSAPSLPPTDTTSPSPATGEPPPPATEAPSPTSEPSLPPPTGSTPPPTTGDPPPTSSPPPPPDESPTGPPPPTDEPQPPTNTPSPPPTTVSPTTGGN